MIGDILQPTHLLFIFIVALVVMGPKRLPEVAKTLGKGLREFRGALSGIEDETRGFIGDTTVHIPATGQPTTPERIIPEPHAPASTVSSTVPVHESADAVTTLVHEPAHTEATQVHEPARTEARQAHDAPESPTAVSSTAPAHDGPAAG